MIRMFTRLATTVAEAAGKPLTFALCLAVILFWALSGPVFGFSDTWQLVINTGTTIVTFLMVFLIQNTQNRDNAALQAKLDELLHANRNADEAFIGIEHLTDRELKDILTRVEARARRVHGRRRKPVIQTRAEDAGTAPAPSNGEPSA